MSESLEASSDIVKPVEISGDSDIGALIERVKARDEVAARALVEHLHPIVAKVVNAHLPRRDDPEDLYQEIYMKIFSKLGQYRGEAALEHWVGRIARTTCFDRLRRQKVRPEWRWSDLSEDEQAIFTSSIAAAEEPDAAPSAASTLVKRILERLPPQDAWLIRSVDLEERPFDEICKSMQWNKGAARVRLFRARRRLKKKLIEVEKFASDS